MPSDRLLGAVAVEPRRRVVPGLDHAVERRADDRLVRRLDDRREARVLQLELAPLRDVDDELADPDDLAASGRHRVIADEPLPVVGDVHAA